MLCVILLVGLTQKPHTYVNGWLNWFGVSANFSYRVIVTFCTDSPMGGFYRRIKKCVIFTAIIHHINGDHIYHHRFEHLMNWSNRLGKILIEWFISNWFDVLLVIESDSQRHWQAFKSLNNKTFKNHWAQIVGIMIAITTCNIEWSWSLVTDVTSRKCISKISKSVQIYQEYHLWLCRGNINSHDIITNDVTNDEW